MSIAMEEEKYTKLLNHINGIESLKKKQIPYLKKENYMKQ